MQEMIETAAGLAEGAAGPAAGAPSPPKVAKAGRRGFAAMFYAQKSGCDCDACKLLRAEIDGIMTDMMEELSKGADSTDSPTN